jgi:hypothetical protein
MQNELFLTNEFVRSWNNLDISVIEPWLDDDFVYVSHVSTTNIGSKSEYLEFLSGVYKFFGEAVEHCDQIIGAEIGYFQCKPCMILRHIHEPQPTGAFVRKVFNGKEKFIPEFSRITELIYLLKFGDGKIIRSDICFMPDVSKIESAWKILI